MHRSSIALCVLATATILPSLGHAQTPTYTPPLPPLTNSCSPFEYGVWFDGICMTPAVADSLFGLSGPGVSYGYFSFCIDGGALVDGCAYVGRPGLEPVQLTDTQCDREECPFGYEPVYDVAVLREILPEATAGEDITISVSLEIVKLKPPYFYKDYNKAKPTKETKLWLPKFKPGHGPPKSPSKFVDLSFASLLTYDPSVFPDRPDDLVYERVWTESFDPYLGVTDTTSACAIAATRVRGLLEVALQESTLECQTFAPFSSSGLVQLPEYMVSFEHGGQLHPIDACSATNGFLLYELAKAEAELFDQCLQDPTRYIE